jgi:hypothetical protein
MILGDNTFKQNLHERRKNMLSEKIDLIVLINEIAIGERQLLNFNN